MDADRIKLSVTIGAALAVGAVAGWFGVHAFGAGIILALLFVYGVAFFVFVFYLRRRQTGAWSYGVHRFEGEASGHRVTLEFDERLIELNRLRLLVDGDELASDSIFFGTKELHVQTRDGTDLSVKVQSGWLGTCTGAAASAGGGEAQPLVDRTAVQRQ